MSIFSNLFGSSNKSNPYKAAMPYLNQIPGISNQYYNPYIQMGDTGREMMSGLYGQFQGLLPGLQQDQHLTNQYQQMAYDPTGYQQHLGSGFQQDPGYKFNLGEQLHAQSQAMAAGGMAGSPEHEQLAQQLASNLANQHYQGYLSNQLGISGAGLSGLQNQQQNAMNLGQFGLGGMQNLMNSNLQYGYMGSNQSAQNLINNLMEQANLRAGQAQDYRNRIQGGLGGILGFGSGFLGGMAGSI